MKIYAGPLTLYMKQNVLICALLCGVSLLTACKETSTSNIKTTTSSTSSSSLSKTTTEPAEKSKAGIDSEIWREASREGWHNSTRAQATFSSTDSSISKENLQKEARERLAWLLLLDSYNVTRNEKSIAQTLATSNFFASFGKEEIYEKKENGRSMVLIIRKGSNLKNDWNNSLGKLESRFPELQKLRKK